MKKRSVCSVRAHQDSRPAQQLEGLFMGIKEEVVNAEPYLSTDVVTTYPAVVGFLEEGFPKEIFFMICQKIDDLEGTSLSLDAKHAEIEKMMTALGAKGAFATPSNIRMTPAKSRVTEEEELIAEDLANDQEKLGKCVANIKLETADMLLAQELSASLLGKGFPGDRQVLPWLRAHDVGIEELNMDLKDLNRDMGEYATTTERWNRVHKDNQNKLGQHGTRLTTLEREDGHRTSTIGSLSSSIMTLLDWMEKGSKLGSGTGGEDPCVGAEITDLKRVVAVLQRGGFHYSLGGGTHGFAGMGEIEDFVADLPVNNPQVFVDPVIFLGRIGKQVMQVDELRQEEIHEAKVNRSAAKSSYLAAAQSTYPAILVGKTTRDAAELGRIVFNAIKDYELFNQLNGHGGMANFIRKRLKDTKLILQKEIEVALRGHALQLELAKYMLTHSVDFVSMLIRFMEDLRQELLTNGHGPGPYTAAVEKEVWDLCLLMLMVVFDTLWIPRSEAAHANGDPDTANAVALSAAFKTHMEMERFVENEVREHPSILPKLFRHIFENFVSRTDHKELEDKYDALDATVKSLKRQLDALSSKVTGVGGGGGELTANQKKKLKVDRARGREVEE